MKHVHHIVPVHAGGTDDPENLVELTVEEHAEAHRKLFETYNRKEDYLAWKGLEGQISKEEILKEIYKENGRKMGLSNKGRIAPNKGKPMAEEQKEKLRKPKTEEHKEKLRKPKSNTSIMGKYERTDNIRKERSIISREIMKDNNIRSKISAANKIKSDPCPHCGKITNRSNIKRHVDSCKLRFSDNPL